MNALPWTDPFLLTHSQLLDDSHRRWLGRPVLGGAFTPEALAEALYRAPFVLVSHGTGPDPCFNYANLTAQTLWELDWDHFVGRPSRTSAEAVEWAQRTQALGRASQAGFMSGYSGIRITASGRRFRILDGVIWNLLDEAGIYRGQAATFSRWDFLELQEPTKQP